MRPIRLHIALPYYLGDQLIRSMVSAAPHIERMGACIPKPELYRTTITSHYKSSFGMPLMPSEEKCLFDKLQKNWGEKDLFLSFHSICGTAAKCVQSDGILPALPSVIEHLKMIFDDRPIELLLNTVNPGHLMANILGAKLGSVGMTFESAARMRPSWTSLAMKIRSEHPDVPISTWQIEDVPLSWPHIMKRAAGIDRDILLPGSLDCAAALMNEKGQRAFISYIKAAAPSSFLIVTSGRWNTPSSWSPGKLWLSEDTSRSALNPTSPEVFRDLVSTAAGQGKPNEPAWF